MESEKKSLKIGAGKPDNLLKTGNNVICEKMNFAVSEAYKLLRTNLLFSLPDETGCRIIGFTSALKSEGKSTTSINIAYSLAESGKKVLLIEGDMRMPTIAKNLSLSLAPGLSNIFSGEKKVLQQYDGGGVKFSVITAGDIPPNPSELLGSSKMGKIIEQMSLSFDYIIIDLPPVLAVSDTLTISKLLSGIVVIVRQNYIDMGSLAETIRQLKFSKVKILGFVFNSVGKTSNKYYRKSYKNA